MATAPAERPVAPELLMVGLTTRHAFPLPLGSSPHGFLMVECTMTWEVWSLSHFPLLFVPVIRKASTEDTESHGQECDFLVKQILTKDALLLNCI